MGYTIKNRDIRMEKVEGANSEQEQLETAAIGRQKAATREGINKPKASDFLVTLIQSTAHQLLVL